MCNPQVRKLYLLPTCGMRGVLIPMLSVHCHVIGAFNLLRLSYLNFLFVSSCVISCTYSSTAHFMSFLPASSSTLPSSSLSLSSSLSYSYVLGPVLLLIFLPLLIFVFISSYFIFHDSAFSCWLLSFCHFMCVFLKFFRLYVRQVLSLKLFLLRLISRLTSFFIP